VRLVGAGKAAAGMARAAVAIVGDALDVGAVVVPGGAAADIGPRVGPRVRALAGSHPVPDGTSVAATVEVLALASGANADTLVLALLSGGASALLCAPADGLTLADKQAVTRALLDAGADIAAFNTVRKHCSRVKGGGLARAAAGAAGCWTLVLSDVVGDDLATDRVGADGRRSDDVRRRARGARPLRDRAAAGRRRAPPPRSGRRGRRDAEARATRFSRAFTRGSSAGTPTPVDAMAAERRRRGYAVGRQRELARRGRGRRGLRICGAAARPRRAGPIGLVAAARPRCARSPGGLGGRSQHLALAAAGASPATDAVLLARRAPTASTADRRGRRLRRRRGRARAPAAAGVDVAGRARGDRQPSCARPDRRPRRHRVPTGTNVADVVVALRACGSVDGSDARERRERVRGLRLVPGRGAARRPPAPLRALRRLSAPLPLLRHAGEPRAVETCRVLGPTARIACRTRSTRRRSRARCGGSAASAPPLHAMAITGGEPLSQATSSTLARDRAARRARCCSRPPGSCRRASRACCRTSRS
jgi:hydroxypyruvate reductase